MLVVHAGRPKGARLTHPFHRVQSLNCLHGSFRSSDWSTCRALYRICLARSICVRVGRAVEKLGSQSMSLNPLTDHKGSHQARESNPFRHPHQSMFSVGQTSCMVRA